MSEDDRDSGFGKAVAVYLSGKGIGDCEPNGERITDDSFIVHFNSHPEPVEFNLPPAEFASTWTRVVSTTTANGKRQRQRQRQRVVGRRPEIQ
jgi:isoamylase